MLCNRGQMASILGVSEPTLDSRVRAGLPGRRMKNTWEFDTVKVLAYLVAQGNKNVEPAKKAAVELRTAEIDMETREYKLMEMRRTLVHVDDIEQIYEERATVFKSQIAAIPARVAQRLAVTDDPAEVLRILKAEVAEALDVMGSTLFKDPDKKSYGVFRVKGDESAPEPEDDY